MQNKQDNFGKVEELLIKLQEKDREIQQLNKDALSYKRIQNEQAKAL